MFAVSDARAYPMGHGLTPEKGYGTTFDARPCRYPALHSPLRRFLASEQRASAMAPLPTYPESV
jgi:hypothetical protein